MNKFILCFKNIEKSAFIFIKQGLEVVLGILLLLFIKAKTQDSFYGSEKVLLYIELRECITYIILTVTLIIGAGLFIDYAIKREGKK